MGVVEGVEGMEKLLLDAFLALQELDIVDQQNIQLPVLLAELGQLAVLQSLNELIGEALARQVSDPGVLLVGQDVMTDRLKQVRLAQTHATKEKQRIVSVPRLLSHAHAGCMRVMVVGTHYEGFKGIIRIEQGLRLPRDLPDRRFRHPDLR